MAFPVFSISIPGEVASLPGRSFPEPLDYFFRQLVVLDAPIGSDKQLFGRLRGEPLDVDGGIEPFGKIDAQVDVFVNRKEVKRFGQ